MFIGVGIGTTIGAIINYYSSAHYPELIKKWKGFPPPEDRLIGAMIGSPILVIGTFWLGWTGEYASIPWFVPALSAIFIGTGTALIFMSFLVRFDSSLTYIPIFAYIFFFYVPELPRRYVSVGFTGRSNLMDIFLTFLKYRL